MRLKPILATAVMIAAVGCDSDDNNRNDQNDNMNTTTRDRDLRSYPDRNASGTNSGSTGSAGKSSGTNTTGSTGTSGSANVATVDRNFVMEAASGGMFEVQSSRLALQNNASGDQQRIAQMMIDDHTRANQELQTIASRKGITVPTKLQAKHQTMLDRLQNLSPNQFEDQFTEVQVQAHEDTIALFERYAREGQDTELKTFAQRTLPTLRKHLDHLQQGGSGMNDMGNMNTSPNRPTSPSTNRPDSTTPR